MDIRTVLDATSPREDAGEFLRYTDLFLDVYCLSRDRTRKSTLREER
jgi:hypothetical protein